MGALGSKLSLKRKREDDDFEDNIHRRPSPLSSLIATDAVAAASDCHQVIITVPTSPIPTPTTKITDLNDDCLRKCFQYLDLRSLFAVAVANKWLRPTAAEAYKRKFGMKKIQIKGEQFPFWLFSVKGAPIPYDVSVPHEIDDCIHVCGLKICLQFLRCLGSAIDNLTIGYFRMDNKQYDYIHQYINEYCADSLIRIVFQDKLNRPIRQFARPFVNVQSVAVYHSSLGAQFLLFPKWFPNMRSLELRDVKMLDRTMTVPFEYLQELRININDGKFGVTKRMAARLFHLSPQLQKLKIRIGDQGMALSILLNIIEANKLLCHLNVSMVNHSLGVEEWELKRIANEHASLIELDLTGYIFETDDVLMVIKQLKLLKKFCFQLNHTVAYRSFLAKMETMPDQWKSSLSIECLNQHRHLVTLERQA